MARLTGTRGATLRALLETHGIKVIRTHLAADRAILGPGRLLIHDRAGTAETHRLLAWAAGELALVPLSQ